MPEFPQISKAGKWNLHIQQGSSWTRTLNFLDLDVSEYSFRGMIREAIDSRRPLVTMTCVVVGPDEVELKLIPSQTKLLVPGNLYYDVEMFYQESSQDVYVARLLSGRVKVTPEVTR